MPRHFANGLPKTNALKMCWKIDNSIGCQRIGNGARRSDYLTNRVVLPKRATEKSPMNFRGANNGRRHRTRAITDLFSLAARRCRWAVSSQTRSAFMIWAATSGNGAWKVTKETAERPAGTGECCAADPGPRAIELRCNLPIATWSIVMNATRFVVSAACWRLNSTTDFLAG